MTRGKKRSTCTLTPSTKARKKARFLNLFKSSPVTIDVFDEDTQIYVDINDDENDKDDDPVIIIEEVKEIEPWSCKYRPKSIADMAGKHEKLGQIRRYILEWGHGDKNIVPLILGKSGSGKTSLVYALAEEMQYEVFEINCGMTTKILNLTEKLRESINNNQVAREDTQLREWCRNSKDSIKQSSKLVLNSKSLVLFDDIDFMVYEEESGFWKALNNLIQDSSKPIFLTATKFECLLEGLVNHLEIFKIDSPSNLDVVRHIKNVIAKELPDHNMENLEESLSRFHGDLRRALNECQLYDGTIKPEKDNENAIDVCEKLHYDALFVADLLSLQEKPFSDLAEIGDVIKEIDSKLYKDSSFFTTRNSSNTFREKVSELKHRHPSLSIRNVCLSFSPYLCMIDACEKSRRYRTRGSKPQKPVNLDDYLFSKVNETN